MINKLKITLLFFALQVSAYAQQMYKLDIKKSKILWDARKTMGGHYGFILFNSGNLNYSALNKPQQGFFKINMNSMKSTDHESETANQKVDLKLKTAAFFNMPKYPIATMNIKQITQIGSSTNYKIIGDLTIKGITNPVSFTSTIKKNGNNINATAKLKIDRIKWNINHEPKPTSFNLFETLKDKMIADEIAITLQLFFTK
jgi:polyisoprenoid-binding protein YceI